MSGNAAAGNIRITITAANLTGPAITQTTRNVNNLGQATQRVGRTMQGLGNTAPVNRAAQAMGAYGNQTLAAARALERLITPFGLLTAAGSIAGLAALTKNWADAGNAISKTALPLSMTAQSLSEWQIAARLAGASTGQLDEAMSGLSTSLSDAHWGRNAALAGLLRSLNVEFDGLDGKARTAEDALGDVARAMAKMRGDPGAQARFADALGISRDLIPMLLKLEEFHARARRTNGAMTTEMVDNAVKLRSSWEEFSATFEGVTNRIVNSWSGTVKQALDASSNWIQNNQKLADSLTVVVGGGLTALTTSLAFAKMMRMMGYAVRVGGMLKTAGLIGAGVALTGAGGGEATPEEAEERRQEFLRNRGDINSGIGGWIRRQLGWAPPAGTAAGGVTPPGMPTLTYPGAGGGAMPPGMPTLTYSGAGGAGPRPGSPSAEERRLLDAIAGGEQTAAGYNSLNRTSGAYGRYQFKDATRDAVLRQMGLPPGTPLTPELQDRMALLLARGRGWNPGMTPEQAAATLNQEWPSLPGGSQQNTTMDVWKRRLGGGGAGPGPAMTSDLRGSDVAGFIMHHTGGRGTTAGVQNTLNQRGLGVEYVMDREGNITITGGRGSRQIQPGWGAGEGLNNANTVGMEVIANDDKDVTPAQVAAAKAFIAANYPNTPVWGHGEVNPGHKQATEGLTIANAIRADRDMEHRTLSREETTGLPAGQNGGTVRVDVHLHGAPPGTRAAATGTGAVTVTPPRVETQMPMSR